MEFFFKKSLFFDFLNCRADISQTSSYENIDELRGEMELNTLGKTLIAERSLGSEAEQTPLDARHRRQSMRRLVRQASTINTQKTTEGTMQLTYWF